jgi:hypothetical protein
MQKLSVWTMLICLVTFIVMVTGCQCGTSATTTPSTTAPSSTTPASTLSPTTPATSTPTPSTSTPAETSLPLTLYESTEHGFSIEYPQEWVANTYEAATNFRLQVGESEGGLALSLSVDYALGAADLDEVVAQGKEYMAAMPQSEMLSEGYITLDGGLSGYEMIGKACEESDVLHKYRYIALVREEQVFWLGVSGEPDAFDAQRQLVDTIIDSFKLLPSYTYEPPPIGPGGTYTSDEYGFSITCPAGWDDYTTGEHGEVLDLRADAGIPEVMVRAWQEPTTIEGASLTLQQIYSENFADYELLSEGEIALADGTPAYEFMFNATMEGYFLTCKCVTVVRETDVFSIMGLAPPSIFTQNEAVIDEIIGSFHLE